MVAASAGRWFRLRRGARRRDTGLWTPGHLRRRGIRAVSQTTRAPGLRTA